MVSDSRRSNKQITHTHTHTHTHTSLVPGFSVIWLFFLHIEVLIVVTWYLLVILPGVMFPVLTLFNWSWFIVTLITICVRTLFPCVIVLSPNVFLYLLPVISRESHEPVSSCSFLCSSVEEYSLSDLINLVHHSQHLKPIGDLLLLLLLLPLL